MSIKNEQELLTLLYKKAEKSANPYYFVEVSISGEVKTLFILNPALNHFEIAESLAAVKAKRDEKYKEQV